ncbi:hypothetical protein BDB01DRAFT_854064 [Pilobolus umbonatus]|nr:hypothetical protein BDB01DRAFT_854064 [Pilobolus umbonatus]
MNTLFQSVGSTPVQPEKPIEPVIEQPETVRQKYERENRIPCFFLNGEHEEEKEIPKNKLARSGSINLGYGDRRLSHILSNTEQKQQKEPVTTDIKKKMANANMGIFGDGIPVPKKDESPKVSAIPIQPEAIVTTIRVFGYSPASNDKLIHHFSKYGLIREYSHSDTGNWTCITYDDPKSSQEALASHGTLLDHHLIGVVLDPKNEQCDIRLVYDETTGLYKRININDTLMFGKMGVIMYHPTTPEYKDQPMVKGVRGVIKNLFSGW